tara:strand:- start:1338 stop:2207 length:870 start_codon:yes stop_codon:yes gene_type:complete
MPETNDFRVFCSVSAFEKAGDDNPMRIGGIVSTDELDQDDEKILQDGLDFSEFLTKGWFNDNHGKKTGDVLGYPSSAFLVKKGQQLPNGTIAKSRGWWADGYLLNTEEGRRIWALTQALEKAPRKLGFSIEGKVVSRDPKNPRTICKARVRNVAITHCPVNMGTSLHALAKALSAGSAIASPGTSPGEGFPLRSESLEGGKPAVQTAPESMDDEEDTSSVVKAEADADFELELVDEISFMEEWANTLSASIGDSPMRLTKAEARSIAVARLPGASESEIDHIVQSATRE